MTQDRYDTSPIRFALLSLCCQFVGISSATALGGMEVPFPLLFVAHSLISGTLSRFLGLSRTWQAFNFLLPGALYLSVNADIPGWAWASGLVVLGLVYLPTFWTKVPFFATESGITEPLAAQLPKSQPFTFIDIGCGDAKLIAELSKRFPLGKFSGYEISPLSYLFSYSRKLISGNRFQIYFKDFWKLPWTEDDFIYCFLSPAVMSKVGNKFDESAKSGAVLVSNSFSIPNRSATSEITIESKRQPALYIYKKN